MDFSHKKYPEAAGSALVAKGITTFKVPAALLAEASGLVVARLLADSEHASILCSFLMRYALLLGANCCAYVCGPGPCTVNVPVEVFAFDRRRPRTG